VIAVVAAPYLARGLLVPLVINAAALFIALLFFGWLWGAAGLLLGAPLIAIAKVVCDRVEALQPVGDLLGA
jgi:predicted PurR-regulated permease PerM